MFRRPMPRPRTGPRPRLTWYTNDDLIRWWELTRARVERERIDREGLYQDKRRNHSKRHGYGTQAAVVGESAKGRRGAEDAPVHESGEEAPAPRHLPQKA